MILGRFSHEDAKQRATLVQTFDYNRTDKGNCPHFKSPNAVCLYTLQML